MYHLGYARPEPQPWGMLKGAAVPHNSMWDPTLQPTHTQVMYTGKQV